MTDSTLALAEDCSSVGVMPSPPLPECMTKGFLMPHRSTLFTGQRADLPLEEVARLERQAVCDVHSRLFDVPGTAFDAALSTRVER
jgi:hypothetical protein